MVSLWFTAGASADSGGGVPCSRSEEGHYGGDWTVEIRSSMLAYRWNRPGTGHAVEEEDHDDGW